MEAINYNQILILISQCIIVSILLLSVFRLRGKMGLYLLFTTLGLFQYLQVFLASTIYYEIAKGIFVSPGSTVLFAGSLFAVLIVYIKEDAMETRKIIYALLIANVLMSVLLYMFSWNLGFSELYNPFNVSTGFFEYNAWVLFVGTLTMFLDAILVIVLFEFISKYIRQLFLRILFTMLIVLSFDATVFSVGVFVLKDNFTQLLLSGLIAKISVGFIYSTLFYIYLRFFDKESQTATMPSFRDVFYSLSYRQKYEIVSKETEKVKQEALKSIQESEIKYQTLVDSSPVGIFRTRADGYTIYVNQKWCSMSGINKEDALGNGWLKAVHPDDRKIVLHNWDAATELLKPSYAEYRFLHSDGSVSWVLGQAVPEINNENEIIGYVGTITDISELKQIEAELNKAKDKAEESDRLKSAFLANMSHEIRTPMNGILGFAELLQEPKLTGEEHEEYIKIIEQSGIRLLNIINDIIDISKIESGQMKLNLSYLKINEQLKYIYNFFKPEADKNGLTLSCNYGLNLTDTELYTDKEKFIGILTNLVKNAIKYTPSGTIEMGYNLTHDNNIPKFIFYVKDTGIGIPKNRLEAIFNRFVQADIEDRQAKQGAGLGLSITKAYVEMLGGTIWVESEVNNGSSFYFSLPA